MLDYVFFTQPFRRWIINLHDYMPSKMQQWVLDRLYPDDCLIRAVDI